MGRVATVRFGHTKQYILSIVQICHIHLIVNLICISDNGGNVFRRFPQHMWYGRRDRQQASNMITTNQCAPNDCVLGAQAVGSSSQEARGYRTF